MPRPPAQQETSLVSQMIPQTLSIIFWIQQDTRFTEQQLASYSGLRQVRLDISFAVKELSRSLQAPTQHDEKQLKHVLWYLKGTLHFTTSLQPPRKRVVEQVASIQTQAYSDSDWAGCPKTRRSTGASLSLWGVSLATSSRTQATQALSSAEAELYAMGMAIQDALHLKSLLQEMKLPQLAKPFELTVYTDSSNGKALASKLGLTRKSKHVQLRYLFMQDLVANGQLKLSKIPTEKNPADVLTKYLSASTLHKLLPKLGVMTRAADSKDLLSVISLELPACSPATPDSFFIGMMAEEPVTAQLVASCVASRPLPSSSLLPGNPGQLSASSTTTLLVSALCTQCWGTRLLSIFLSIFLGWAALAYQGKSLIVSASFAQSSSFSSSALSFSFSFRRQLEADMVSFKHEQLIKVQLANEAYTLTPSLLKHIYARKLVKQAA